MVMMLAATAATSAVNRFGLGARAGDLQTIGSDSRGWLLAQLQPASPIATFNGLPGSRDYLRQYRALAQLRKQAREAKAEKGAPVDAQLAQREARRAMVQGMRHEWVLRQRVAATSDTGFHERLVRFWSNHFAISVDKSVASQFAAPMEREAIRPNISGKFADLLLAVERHPGMLLYLDNQASIGDDSRAAINAARRGAGTPKAGKRGLNENLAREIMELHTLGVNAGYSQQDVTEFARAITGWSVVRDNDRGGADAFIFRANAHEPGLRRVFGKTYRQEGEAQGIAVLHTLAVHPATAQHVSLQLARHFVADAPPPKLVERMAKAWVSSGGDLPSVYRAMIEDDTAWQPAARKFKNPDDFFISALRACGLDGEDDVALAVRLQAQLGQPLFQPRSPAGFGDVAADWGGPDALFKRVQAAQALANRLPEMHGNTPLNLGEAALGARLDTQTATALRRAESVQQGVALLLASPAFQWRT